MVARYRVGARRPASALAAGIVLTMTTLRVHQAARCAALKEEASR
jgi:hypothetical protein